MLVVGKAHGWVGGSRLGALSKSVGVAGTCHVGLWSGECCASISKSGEIAVRRPTDTCAPLRHARRVLAGTQDPDRHERPRRRLHACARAPSITERGRSRSVGGACAQGTVSLWDHGGDFARARRLHSCCFRRVGRSPGRRGRVMHPEVCYDRLLGVEQRVEAMQVRVESLAICTERLCRLGQRRQGRAIRSTHLHSMPYPCRLQGRPLVAECPQRV